MMAATTPQKTLRIALAQLNPTVGDIAGNAAKLREARLEAARLGADLVMFPELFLAGYPPEDLVLKPAFQDVCRAGLRGACARDRRRRPGRARSACPGSRTASLYNAYALLDDGAVAAVRFKVDLPNYGVFDEKRVFTPGPLPGPVVIRGVRVGVPICEDIWGDEVVECLAETGGRDPPRPERLALLARQDRRAPEHRRRARHRERPAARLSQPGRRPGRARLRRRLLRRSTPTARSPASSPPSARRSRSPCGRRARRAGAASRLRAASVEEGDEADYAACVLGLRDYVDKNRFPGVVLGLSGGIDSALCAAMAVDALGPERVHCVMLPYRYTSNELLSDAADCAERLGVRYDMRADRRSRWRASRRRCSRSSTAGPRDITEENIQSRARGTILMAISNKFGPMVVTTGNKSEMSVGYATLYGDMNGGYNPIKDLYKMEVYRLSALRNRWKPRGRARAGRRGHPGEHHRQGADGGAAREPEGPGFAAALRGRSTTSSNAWSSTRCASREVVAPRARPRDGEEDRAPALRSPSTSAGRRRRASRSRARTSAATAAIRSSTASATRARWRTSRTRRWRARSGRRGARPTRPDSSAPSVRWFYSTIAP